MTDRVIFDNFRGTPTAEEPQGTQLIGITRFTLPDSEIKTLHFHETLELGICLSGVGECCMPDRSVPTKQGDIELFYPYQPHLSRSMSGCPNTWDFLQIDLAKIMERSGFVGKDFANGLISGRAGISGILDANSYPQIAELVAKIIDEAWNRSENYTVMISLLITELLIVISRLSADMTETGYPIDPKLVAVMPALDYVYHNYWKDIKADTLAEVCGMSLSRTRELFKAVTGCSPKEYINLYRINYSERLLAASDSSVREIGIAVGFHDPSSFYRAFSLKNGTSPFEYRRRNHVNF